GPPRLVDALPARGTGGGLRGTLVSRGRAGRPRLRNVSHSARSGLTVRGVGHGVHCPKREKSTSIRAPNGCTLGADAEEGRGREDSDASWLGIGSCGMPVASLGRRQLWFCPSVADRR